MTLTAGVIAVQGNVAEHASAIERAASRREKAVEVFEVRELGVVPNCDFLAMPGGESTAISSLLEREGIAVEIVDHVAAGKPLLATCAGLIVAARDAGDDRIANLGVANVTVKRNAFGRQKDSFETGLTVKGFEQPFPAVFIRAPVITAVGDEVEVLADQDGRIVAFRDYPVVGTAFHPELTDDSRFHDLSFFRTDDS